MIKILSKPEYLESIAASRDDRMDWWRKARYGMFVHIGLYAGLGRNEWAMAFENWPKKEYEKLADRLTIQAGAPLEWVRLAKEAGMKYVVLTTRHHEGFSLWDSKVNPYNSMNYGPRRDIVREFTDACRQEDMKIGFYSSLMDWHHPDGGKAAYDSAARKRFNDYIYALNEELLTGYGKIDVLWYDVPCPMETFEGWNSLEMNQRLRAIQPDIIINNRSHLPEDFGTPEEHITADENNDWEACMTFNGISWGYVPSEQAKPYSYNSQGILRMLSTVAGGGGNLLLNIGPASDGSIPPEALEPLKTTGQWLSVNGEGVYGSLKRSPFKFCSGVCSVSVKERFAYIWNWIWPQDGELILGGFATKLLRATVLADGTVLDFTQEPYRILLRNLPEKARDPIAGVTVLKLEFEESPKCVPFAASTALTNGKVISDK